MDFAVLEAFAKDNIGMITFEEAYKKTGKILNIIVNARKNGEKLFILNHVSAPNVLIWTAACVSCSIPGLYDSATLKCKDANGNISFWDYSLFFTGTWKSPSWNSSVNLKLSRLSELFHVNHMIVSHINPYIVFNPFFLIFESIPQCLLKLFYFFAGEVRHFLRQLRHLGIIPSWASHLQSYLIVFEGDVNIYPKLEFNDYLLLLSNQSVQVIGLLNEFIKKGEKSTWRVLEEIKIRCLIERTLDKY